MNDSPHSTSWNLCCFFSHISLWLNYGTIICCCFSEYKGRDGDRLGKMATEADWELVEQLKSEV